MKLNLKECIKLHNRYELALVDSVTGKIKQTAIAENVVLDNLFSIMNRTSGNLSLFGGIAFGTGSGTPAASDTSLFRKAFSYIKTMTQVRMEEAYPTSTYVYTVDIPATSNYTGELTEIGLLAKLDSYSGEYLWTHAMLADAEGNPITITKTDLDVLTVTATVYVTLGTSDTKFKWFKPGPLNIINRAFRSAEQAPFPFANGRHSIYHCSGIPYDNGVITDVVSPSDARLGTSTVDNASKTVSIPSVRMLATAGNTNYYNGLVIASSGGYLGGIILPDSEVFPNQTISNISVGIGDGTKNTFSVPIEYFVEGTDKVYVNGVLQERGVDYTIGNVHAGPVSTASVSNFLEPISGLSEAANGVDALPGISSVAIHNNVSYAVLPLAQKCHTKRNVADVLLKSHNPMVFHVCDNAPCKLASKLELANIGLWHLDLATPAFTRSTPYRLTDSYYRDHTTIRVISDYHAWYWSPTAFLYYDNAQELGIDIPDLGLFESTSACITHIESLIASNPSALPILETDGAVIGAFDVQFSDGVLPMMLYKAYSTDQPNSPCYYARCSIGLTEDVAKPALLCYSVNESICVGYDDCFYGAGAWPLSDRNPEGEEYRYIFLVGLTPSKSKWFADHIWPAQGIGSFEGCKIILSGSHDNTTWTQLASVMLGAPVSVDKSVHSYSYFKTHSIASYECSNVDAYEYYRLELDKSEVVSQRLRDADAIAMVPGFYSIRDDSDALYSPMTATFALSYTTGDLVFTNPPVADAVITMDVDIDRPFKNENFVIDSSMTLRF